MFLTILTPTYNRGNTLPNLYLSLKNQTNKNFEWIIVDDGSEDNTKKVVNNFISDSNFKIKYIKKINGGKHTAINKGVENINSDFVFIVDSDDFIANNSVEIIYNTWSKYFNNPNISSLWFLIKDKNNEIIGDEFPKNEFISNYKNVLINNNISGDKKAVYRTNILKEFPFPSFRNEKFLGEGIIHKRISDKYNSVFINKAIYIADYLEDGLTASGRKLRIKNPLGGMAISNEFISNGINLKYKIKKSILYTTYGFFSDKQLKEIFNDCNSVLLFLLTYPISLLLYLYWRLKYLK